MAQQKKPKVREAILEAAFRLFAAKGYAATGLTEIGNEAGVSKANLYVYFSSKLEILYAIYDPWLRTRISVLESEIAQIASGRDQLRALLRALWRDIPAEENGFVNNVMQAASSAQPVEGYRPTLVLWLEERVTLMIQAALPESRYDAFRGARLAHLLIMAFDGFAIQRHLFPAQESAGDAILEAMVDMLMGETGADKSAHPRIPVLTEPKIRRRAN